MGRYRGFGGAGDNGAIYDNEAGEHLEKYFKGTGNNPFLFFFFFFFFFFCGEVWLGVGRGSRYPRENLIEGLGERSFSFQGEWS